MAKEWHVVHEVQLNPKRNDYKEVSGRLANLLDWMGQHLRASGFTATTERDIRGPIHKTSVLVYGQVHDADSARLLLPVPDENGFYTGSYK